MTSAVQAELRRLRGQPTFPDKIEDFHRRFPLPERGHHPASLNMGDCFAYACAKSLCARLLYTGADFARTNLA